MQPDEFTEYVHRHFAVQGFVVGADFRYGYQRSGNTEVLRAYAEQTLFAAVVPLVEHAALRISSTSIPNSSARSGQSRTVLGPSLRMPRHRHRRWSGRASACPRPMSISENIIPAVGVYAGEARLDDGRTFKAAINIGHLPTINLAAHKVLRRICSIFLKIYGQSISLSFQQKLHEKRFASLAELTAQIQQDIATVRAGLPVFDDLTMPGATCRRCPGSE